MDELTSKEIEEQKKFALDHLRVAERAWYAYFCMCDVGPERTAAADIYEDLRNILRR